MNTKLVVLFALVSLVCAQYPPEFEGGALPPGGPEGEEAYAPQPDFEGENAEVPFESTQEGAFEGGEYGPPQGMIPNEQMQPGPYGPQGYNPEEGMQTMHRPKFMPFKK